MHIFIHFFKQLPLTLWLALGLFFWTSISFNWATDTYSALQGIEQQFIYTVILCASYGLVSVKHKKTTTFLLGVFAVLSLCTFYSFGRESFSNNIQTKQALYLNSIKAIKNAPILGVGVSNFEQVYPKYHKAYMPTPVDVYDLDKTPKTPQSSIIQILVELGVIGLIFYLGLIFVFFKSAFKSGVQKLKQQPLLLGVTATFSLLLISIFLSSALHSTLAGSAFYMALGLGAGFYNTTHHIKKSFKILLSLIALIGLIFIGADQVQRLKAQQQKDAESTYLAYPNDIENLKNYTAFLSKNSTDEDLEKAIEYQNKLLTLRPFMAEVYLWRMHTYMKKALQLKKIDNSKFNQALAASLNPYARLNQLADFRPEPFIGVAQYYVQKKDYPNAYLFYNKALERQANNTDAIIGIKRLEILALMEIRKQNLNMPVGDYLKGKHLKTFGQKLREALEKNGYQLQQKKANK